MEKYESPEMEIILFDTEDVITTSPGDNNVSVPFNLNSNEF